MVCSGQKSQCNRKHVRAKASRTHGDAWAAPRVLQMPMGNDKSTIKCLLPLIKKIQLPTNCLKKPLNKCWFTIILVHIIKQHNSRQLPYIMDSRNKNTSNLNYFRIIHHTAAAAASGSSHQSSVTEIPICLIIRRKKFKSSERKNLTWRIINYMFGLLKCYVWTRGKRLFILDHLLGL